MGWTSRPKRIVSSALMKSLAMKTETIRTKAKPMRCMLSRVGIQGVVIFVEGEVQCRFAGYGTQGRILGDRVTPDKSPKSEFGRPHVVCNAHGDHYILCHEFAPRTLIRRNIIARPTHLCVVSRNAMNCGDFKFLFRRSIP